MSNPQNKFECWGELARRDLRRFRRWRDTFFCFAKIKYGLTEFATIALEQLDARKSRVISYYDQIKFCRNMHMS